MLGRAIAKSLSLSTSTISKYLRQLEPSLAPTRTGFRDASGAGPGEEECSCTVCPDRAGLGPSPSGASGPQGRHPPASLGRVPEDNQGAGILPLPLLQALCRLRQTPEAVLPEHLCPGGPSLH